MTHAALAALAVLFALALGHGHSPYSAALMLAAIARDARQHGGP